MRRPDRPSTGRLIFRALAGALASALILTAPGWAQTEKGTSDQPKGGPVVRTFGAEGGYRTEVRSETKGTLSQEDWRQVALLAAQVFQHIDEARQAIDAEDAKTARQEVDKGRQAIQAIRALLPRTTVHTKTTAPDGKVVYEDEREVQEDWVPLFEGMLHTQTLAPILAAKQQQQQEQQQDKQQQEAAEIAGVRLVGSEMIATEVRADLDLVENQLKKAAKALADNQMDNADRALAVAQVRGVEFLYNKEDSPLAEARDAIWLTRRSLEENNVPQARANLDVARQRLRVYREIAPQERQQDVDQMLKEAEQLEAQLRQETTQQPANRAERTRQGRVVTQWWERINSWFRKHF
ncbi:MAG: YfdX family protein [Isosphaeraceae bacterium]|nr:YfdX family protein [Isosphaeraceae bacterium]